MFDEQGQAWCDRCGGPIAEQGTGGYIVRIEVLADPRTPPIDLFIGREEIRDRIRQAIEELSALSSQEAMDQVYRRFEFWLCPECQRTYIEDPLGREL